jgi:flagellar assembly factor FliW
MKILAEPPPVEPAENIITLPAGIIGFPQHHSAEIFNIPDQLPFQWLRLKGPPELHFVVIEPAGIIPDYVPELFDEDAKAIGLESAQDAYLLNIVTVRENQEATVNLAGPIVINLRNGVGRQLVIANHNAYSAHHLLVSNP